MRYLRGYHRCFLAQTLNRILSFGTIANHQDNSSPKTRSCLLCSLLASVSTMVELCSCCIHHNCGLFSPLKVTSKFHIQLSLTIIYSKSTPHSEIIPSMACSNISSLPTQRRLKRTINMYVLASQVLAKKACWIYNFEFWSL